MASLFLLKPDACASRDRLLNHDCLLRVWGKRIPAGNIRVSRFDSIGKFDIVVHQDSCTDQLDLIRSEKTAQGRRVSQTRSPCSP